MGQLVTIILNVMILLMVPLGILQVHAVMQMKGELHEISLAATKFISNHGGRSDDEVADRVSLFIKQELEEKSYRLNEAEIQTEVVRVKAADPLLWSHEDEFRLSIGFPYPLLTSLFPKWEKPLVVERTGTINIMDYDL